MSGQQSTRPPPVEIDHQPAVGALQEPFADHLRVLSRVDPYGDTVFTPDEMSDLLSDVEHLEAKARDGPEKRGIRRLRVLATRCSVLPNSRMMALGD